jgi:PIN domain nuclease of toxin-antitoxin system
MNLLLDTHAVLWVAMDPSRIPAAVALAVKDRGNDVAASAVSLWEIALKIQLGKLRLEGCSPEDLPDALARMDITTIPLEPADAASFHRLPREAHRDPFDRMLVWQAIRAGRDLVTADAALKVYEPHGLRILWR